MKQILFLMFICLSGSSFAQTVITSVNTPAATSGADYESEVVSGLEEYKQRKQVLQNKAEKVRLEQKRLAEEEYRRKMAEALREQQEKEALRIQNAAKVQKTPKAPVSNSNQDYFDRQTKILQQNK